MADRPAPQNGQILVAPDDVRLLAHPEPLIRPAQVTAPAIEPIVSEIPFTGRWIPGPDPLVIGPQNFSVLQNLRYRDGELQSVLGYSKITVNPHATYVKGRSGIQFYKTINALPLNILLVHAYNAALSASAILVHTAGVPQTGDFNSLVLHTDAAGAGRGRFALAPNQQVAYANGKEAMIWAGEEHRIAAFIVTNAAGTTDRDYTEAVSNVLGDAQNVAVIHDGGTAPYILIRTTRPASGFKFYLGAPQTNAVTASVFYWGASGWTVATNQVDGTLAAGASLGQTGTIAFDDTQAVARVKFDHEQVGYWYQVRFSGATSAGTTVYYATARLPFQSVKDIWDGSYRDPIIFMLFKDGKFQDFTVDVLEQEAGAGAFAAPLSVDDPDNTDNPFTPADHLIVGFTEPTMAMRWRMADKRINGNAATTTVQYWDGDGYATVANFSDGTLDPGGTVAVTRSGTMSWTPPDPGVEFPQALFGLTGFFYKVFWSADLSAEVSVDQIQGVPAPRLMHGAVFPWQFQGRLLLMGDTLGNQGHKADYSATNAPDVWNGEDTSGQGKELFFGTGGVLTAAAEIYNRFAGSLAYLGVVTKDDETMLLSGNSPDSFSIFPVSKSIGCPAPETMCTAEVAYSVAEDAQRNIAIWLSHEAVVAFDGSVIVPIPGIEPYFDAGDPRRINQQAIQNAVGWYDHEQKEYNLLAPSGVNQTACNVWLCYDLKRQRWFEKVPAVYPQMGFAVKDLKGSHYTYAMIDTGHLLRTEHGYTWDGGGILQRAKGADLLPAQTTFEETILRDFRLVLVRGLGSSVNLTITHYADSAAAGTTLATVALVPGSQRLVLSFNRLNRRAISHQFEFVVTTTDQQLTWLLAGAWFERARTKGR